MYIYVFYFFPPETFPSDSFKYYCRQLSDSLIFHCLTLFTRSPLWIHSDEPEPMSLTK